MSNAFFNLGRPMAPRLIQCFYYIALVFIALGLVRGLIGGVRMIAAPPWPSMVAGAPANPGAAPPATAQAQPPAGPPGAMAPPRGGPGMRGMRRFGGPMMGRGPLLRGPAFLRGAPPALQGGVMILLVLLRAVIGWMVVRILAEIGTVLLAMRNTSPATP